MSTSEEKAVPRSDSDAAFPPAKTVPILGEGFQETGPLDTTDSTENSDVEVEEESAKDGTKPAKRRLFGFGRKKDDKGKKNADSNHTSKVISTSGSAIHSQTVKMANSPIQSTHPYMAHSPPPYRNLQSSSPRVVSPAGSQIFERDVQESSVPVPNSPAIPSHIQTENHIPSVLDASSEAITDSKLDPDTVEIIMHSSHQPAAVTVTGVGSSEATGASWSDDQLAHPDKDDAASNYGALDNTDVRRLSFISFADVVQSEHAEHSAMRDSVHIAGLTSLSSGHRSPSPMRSPVSSQGMGTSPPTSKSASIKGVEMSPSRGGKPLASPTSTIAPSTGGELTIETMSQALKRSGDVSGSLSLPLSPVSPDGLSDRPFR
jgi:hypothetical protein